VKYSSSSPESQFFASHRLIPFMDLLTFCRIRAKTCFAEMPSSRTHSHEIPLFFHDFSFLPRFNDSHPRTHTFNAGSHSFPFSLHLPANLPATLRTYTGSGNIAYQLKCIVARPGFTATNWVLKKPVPIRRGLKPDSEEYIATLEIGACVAKSILLVYQS
jgi:hypothetical protein